MPSSGRTKPFRSIASKFFILTAALVFWIIAVLLAYDLRQDSFDVSKGILLLIIVVLVAGAISRMTIRLLARPLRLLQDGIYSVREGRLEPIPVSRTADEIEFLGESFNEMISALAATRQELLRNQEELEDRIQQRTEELQVAMQDALAASQAKSEFLANISHELRTPMNGLLGMLNLVLDSGLQRQQHEQLETARRCAYSLLALLNDVLDLSKIEAGRMVLERIPFDPRALIEDCIQSQAPVAARKGVKLGRRIEGTLPPRVLGDSLRLRQVLANLLSNAVKFTDAGSVAVIASAAEDPPGRARLRIDVVDTGIGIPEDKLQYIFEKFTQADNSISRRYGGTGLGLAIARSLVEMHGGSIDVKSELGNGSTFAVSLDYDLAPEEQAPALRPAQPERAAAILVVEDNAVNQKIIAAMLERHGYRVGIAGNGREALDALARDEFRLVLMDVQMPVIDGLQASRLIRANERWAKLPIIAMTARAMDGDMESCFEAGMNAYVSKPVQPEHLLSIVEQFAGDRPRTVVARVCT